jgi:hypothetical protein
MESLSHEGSCQWLIFPISFYFYAVFILLNKKISDTDFQLYIDPFSLAICSCHACIGIPLTAVLDDDDLNCVSTCACKRAVGKTLLAN